MSEKKDIPTPGKLQKLRERIERFERKGWPKPKKGELESLREELEKLRTRRDEIDEEMANLEWDIERLENPNSQKEDLYSSLSEMEQAVLEELKLWEDAG